MCGLHTGTMTRMMQSARKEILMSKKKFVKGFARALALILAVIMIVTSFMILPFAGEVNAEAYTAYGAEAGTTADAIENEDLQRLAAYMKYIHENFKDKVDYDTLIDGAFNGVTEALNDRFSVYYPATEDQEQFTSQVNGTFEGVGVSIKMSSSGECTVEQAISGGPALKAGIKAGDIITAVDGISTSGMELSEISNRLRGEKGTAVKVTVLRGGVSMNFDLTRDTINEECLSYEMLDGNIGYIKMTGFDSDAGLEFKKAKLALANSGAETLIIDLRGNPGGYVEQALDIADQILESGYISHFESRGKIIKTYKATAAEKVYQPIVMLVDGDTASSSEILAAALQDNDAAVIVGTNTYGKGIAQQIIALGDDKSAKLSTFYFLTPDENAVQGVGIKPDVKVENMTAIELKAAQEAYAGFAPMSEKEKPGLGATGLNAYGAQQRLSLLGYDVTVTGTIDDKTFKAVKEFQSSQGLWAYGVLDYTTCAKLDETVAAYVQGNTLTDKQLEKAVEIAKTL